MTFSLDTPLQRGPAKTAAIDGSMHGQTAGANAAPTALAFRHAP